MSKELNNIENTIMSQINQGKIKMKPKIYFILGSISTLIGIISTIVVSSFMVSLIRFSLRTHYGWRAKYKLEQMWSAFPWWLILVATISLILGIWLIKKYDFVYKIKLWTLITGFVLVIFISGLFIDMIGFNDNLYRRGYMKKIIKDQSIETRLIKPIVY